LFRLSVTTATLQVTTATLQVTKDASSGHNCNTSSYNSYTSGHNCNTLILKIKLSVTTAAL
jgi:hypothetical protein